MKNRRGFTLVELLAVVVILGIITGISIPLIRNIQEQNTMRKFTTYQDSLKVSAKLYVDSFEEDLFGHEKSGCAVIRYDQLEDKSLIKDISVDKESCNSNLTCVRVVKVDGKLSYYPMIGCGSPGADGKVGSVELQLPSSGSCDETLCGVDSSVIVGFSADPDSSNAITFKRKNIKVKMSSYTGFHEDIDIEYSFVNSIGAPSNDTDDPTVVGGWQKLHINYMGGKEQKQKISAGNIITISSDTVTTPSGLTGDYYLVLKVIKLKNIDGREWSKNASRGKYVYFGPYRVDNTKPEFGDGSTVISSENDHNDIKPKLSISGTDNYSTTSDLRMCTSYDSDSCSKVENDIKQKQNGWVTYDGNQVISKIQDDQDGSTHTIYVSIGDAAGNYSTFNVSYRISLKVIQHRKRTRSINTCTKSCCGTYKCNCSTNYYQRTSCGCSSGSQVSCNYNGSGLFTVKCETCQKCNKTCTKGSCCGYTSWSAWSSWADSGNNCNSETCESQSRIDWR